MFVGQLNAPIAFGTIRAMLGTPIAREETAGRYVGDYLRKAEVVTTPPTRPFAPETSRACFAYLESQGGSNHVLR